MNRKVGTLSIFVFICLMVTACKAPPPSVIQESLDRGNRYFKEGKYQQAITSYDSVITALEDGRNPNLTTAYYNRGLAYLMNRNYERAIEDFGSVIDTNPRDARAYRNRGKAYAKTKNHDRAIEDFKTAITLDPDDIDSYYALGMTHFMKSEYIKTADVLSTAIAHDPNYAKAYNGRGQAYLKSGKVENAIHDFQKACDMGEKCGCIMLDLISHDKNLRQHTVKGKDTDYD